MKQLVITGALVYTGGRFVQREVYVQEGRIAQLAKKSGPQRQLVADLLSPGDLVVLVVPQLKVPASGSRSSISS